MGRRHKHNQGAILLVVLWVVALLSILAYGLIARTRMGLREEAWARMASDADQMLASLGQVALQRLQEDEDDTVDSLAEDWGKPFAATSSEMLGQYEGGLTGTDNYRLQLRAIDESAKINVNAADGNLLEEVLRAIGAPAPREIAQAILDWRGDESHVSADYYLSQSPAYTARGDRLERLEELLYVRGIDDALFFGEDYNRNGVLDDNENDGDTLWPSDDADGRLKPGLIDLLTVHPKDATSIAININGVDLIKKPIFVAVLQGVLDSNVDAVADKLIARTQGDPGDPNDGQPFSSNEEIIEFLTTKADLDSEMAALAASKLEVTSTGFRFVLSVDYPEKVFRKAAEALFIRDADANVILTQWCEFL